MVEEEKKEDKKEEEKEEPKSLYQKTDELFNREEALLKERKEILEREETLHANQRLAGTAGGHIEPEKLSDEEISSNKRVQMIGEMTGAEWAKEKK